MSKLYEDQDIQHFAPHTNNDNAGVCIMTADGFVIKYAEDVTREDTVIIWEALVKEVGYKEALRHFSNCNIIKEASSNKDWAKLYDLLENILHFASIDEGEEYKAEHAAENAWLRHAESGNSGSDFDHDLYRGWDD